MSNGSASNLVTWQKVAIVLIVIFGLIIAFSYFQSARVEQSNVTPEMTLPALEEGQTNLDIFDLPTPENMPVTKIETAPTAVIPDAPMAKTSQPAVEKAPVPVSTPSSKTGSYGIQVSSFRDMEKAKKLQQKLKEGGTDSEIVEKNLGEKGTWYQVVVGPYGSKTEADVQLLEIKLKYPDSFIRKR